jgi:hypothetical protein
MAVSEMDYRFRSKSPAWSQAAHSPAEIIAPAAPVKNRKSEAMKENWRKRREAERAKHLTEDGE